jgi:hypothetical protein
MIMAVKSDVAKVKAGENLHNPIRRVRWSELQRSSPLDDPDGSLFRSWCPVCDAGLLLVRRTDDFVNFVCWDNCTTCGQVFCYKDEEILGTRVLSPEELECSRIHES